MCVTTIDEMDYAKMVSLRWLQRLSASRQPKGARSTESNPVRAQKDFISVRPFRMADALPMYEAARESMEQLRNWMTWCHTDFSLAHAGAFVTQSARAWAHGEQHSFAIVDERNDSFLGSVGLNQLSHAHKFANVGYWVRRTAAGRGVAAAAVAQVAEFGFAELGLHRLEFLIPTSNVASQRVAQKAGAVFEGVLRQRLLISGHTHDAAMYSLVKGATPDL